MTTADAENWVRDWSASMSARAAATQALSDQVAQLKVTATDRDRRIAVTVNGSGTVTDLRLEPGAGRLSMEALADQILRTMRRAQAALADRVAAIAADTVGADSETARAVITGFERRFSVSLDADRDD